MPGMGHGEWHFDTVAQNLLIGYRPDGFIGDKIFPVVNVQKESGIYAKIDKGNWFRVGEQLRAPRTGYRQVGYTVSSGTYRVQNYGLETVHDWETLANADSPHRPREQAGMFLHDQLSLGYEVRVRDKIYTSVGTTATLSGTDRWTDYGNSNPIGDIENAQNALFMVGRTGTRLLLGRRTWQVLRRHPQILQALNPGGLGGGIASQQGFADLIGVDEIIVPTAIQNTAQEGQADVMTEVWSTHAILFHTAAAPGIMVPSFGYAFRWANPELGPGLSNPPNWQIDTKDDDDMRVTKWRTGYYQDECVISPELGYAIATGITS